MVLNRKESENHRLTGSLMGKVGEEHSGSSSPTSKTENTKWES